MTIRTSVSVPALLGAALLLAGCGLVGAGNDVAEIDNQLLANDADPALTSALEDQILVDPTLVQQSNGTSVRPAETPVQAQYPPEQANAARGHGTSRRSSQVHRASGETGPTAAVHSSGACSGPFNYGAAWAQRLPSELPLYPGVRVTEAAGTASGACKVVTFRTNDPHDRVLGWYRGRAERANFSAEQQTRGADHMLGGVNRRTDAAYVVIVTPAQRGSDVALIVSNGS